jgi:dolichol-phosphate mannosyltransferase
VLAIVYGALKVAGTAFPLGNPTVVIVVAFFSGLQMLSLGVIGEYVGRIYDEARQRPKFIIESSYGFATEQPAGRAAPE